MSDTPTVSVIIPTRARAERAVLIGRALESVLTQEDVRVVPLIIINGPERDQALTNELCSDPRFHVSILNNADLPAALLAGRKLVDTHFYTALDDDDILLPRALANRVQVLTERPEFDAVVTNGLRRNAAGDVLHIPDISIVERDPLRAMLEQNWLLAGSWLCRTDRVGYGLFEGMPNFRECTYLAYQLATGFRVTFLDMPTVAYYRDTPLSESKSRDYILAGPAARRRMLELVLPLDVRAQLSKGISRDCYRISRLYHDEGNFIKAWGWHIRSLSKPGGWRYLRSTLRLLYPRWRS